MLTNLRKERAYGLAGISKPALLGIGEEKPHKKHHTPSFALHGAPSFGCGT